ESAETAIGLRKTGVRPGPEMAMPEAAVVALYSEAERIALENLIVQADFPGENSVGVWRTGKTDPTFVAQRDTEIGAVMQIPRQPLSADIEGAAASGLFDAVGTGFEKKGGSPGANMQSFERKLLNEGFRWAGLREPGCPDLHRGSARENRTAVA